MKKKKRKIFLIITLMIISYFLIGEFFYSLVIRAKEDRKFLSMNTHFDNKNLVETDLEEKLRIKDENFIKSHKSEKLTIESRDKLKLVARLYENKNEKEHLAILLHGYNADSLTLSRYIRNFYERGYSVLAPDLRGHGQSQGKYIGMGWLDRLDTLIWIEEVVKKNPRAEIVLWGISMGGTTVMNLSGEKLPKNVKVIIEDCGYTSVEDIFSYQLKEFLKLPSFPVMTSTRLITKFHTSYDFTEARTKDQLKNNTTPILFIHGSEDKFVPAYMLEDLYESSNGAKNKLLVSGAKHGHSEMVDPDLYWKTIWNFIDRYVG